MVKMNIIRAVLSIMVVGDLHLKQLDVKKILLYDALKEDIYIHQP